MIKLKYYDKLSYNKSEMDLFILVQRFKSFKMDYYNTKLWK